MRCITMMGLLGGILVSAGVTPVRAQTNGGAPSFTSSRPAAIQLLARKGPADTAVDRSRGAQARLLERAPDGLVRPSSLLTRDGTGRMLWLTIRSVPGANSVLRFEVF